MGVKVQCKSYLPGFNPMGGFNDNSNIGTCPLYYGDNSKSSSNGQFHYPNQQRTIADAYFGHHTVAVKQKLLEHEATFKTQLHELHRVYRVQRELMDDLKMNELQKQCMALDTSMSSCSASHRQDAPRWLTTSAFPLSSSSSGKPAILGAKDFHSAPSFLNCKSSQNGLGSPITAGSSKDSEVEVLECRPSKARRKFDLELQADEYIDIDEPKAPDVSSYSFNGRCEDAPSSSVKLLTGPSARHNEEENGFPDLNEQMRIQGMNSSLRNFVGCDSNFRSRPQLQTLPRDYMKNSYTECDDSRSSNLIIAQNEKGRGWSHMLDSARSNGHSNSLPGNINFFNNCQDALYQKEGSESGPKYSGGCFFNGLSKPRQSDKSFSTYKAPWDKSGSSCVTQKLVTAEMHPCFNSTSALPRSFQSSGNRAWPLGEGWHINSGNNAAYQNRFYKGANAGSGPACGPASGFDYLTCSNGSSTATGGNVYLNGSINLKDLKSVDASAGKVIDLNIANGDDGDHNVDIPNLNRAADLPWLKSSGGLKNGDGQSSGSSLRIMGFPIFGETRQSMGASSCRASISKEEDKGKSGRVRGFDMNLPCEDKEKDEQDSKMPFFSCRKSHIDLNLSLAEDDDNTTKNPRGFDLEALGDINDEDRVGVKQRKAEISDESLVAIAAETIIDISSSRKLTLTETPSKRPPVTTRQALEWFVDIISLCPDDADKVEELWSPEKEETDSADYFERMTLNLQETRKEEYLPDYPKPPELEEPTGAAQYTTRTRKGQARRGRPRRDFQRDILPGLTTLARHEVTEDLHTLGGLMRATGHSWQSSLTRRVGPRRGRPRLASYLTSTTSSPQKRTTTAPDRLVSMEDNRSLTGWGKTTRRARRQRCLTVNASALHIA